MKASIALICGMAGQAVGIGAGLLITASGMPYGPYVGGLVTVVLVGFTLAKSMKTLQVYQLLLLIPVWAMAYVVGFQTLGFLWFPGLVKDLDPLSKDHLISAVLIFGLVLIVYLGELAVLRLVLGRQTQP